MRAGVLAVLIALVAAGCTTTGPDAEPTGGVGTGVLAGFQREGGGESAVMFLVDPATSTEAWTISGIEGPEDFGIVTMLRQTGSGWAWSASSLLLAGDAAELRPDQQCGAGPCLVVLAFHTEAGVSVRPTRNVAGTSWESPLVVMSLYFSQARPGSPAVERRFNIEVEPPMVNGTGAAQATVGNLVLHEDHSVPVPGLHVSFLSFSPTAGGHRAALTWENGSGEARSGGFSARGGTGVAGHALAVGPTQGRSQVEVTIESAAVPDFIQYASMTLALPSGLAGQGFVPLVSGNDPLPSD